jgi:hypothetical protein
MIKDKVIKPLLIATEKVVEYYFPEEKTEPGVKGISSQHPPLNRSSAGGTTKTTHEDTLSDESNEFSKIRRRLKRLDINSSDDN